MISSSRKATWSRVLEQFAVDTLGHAVQALQLKGGARGARHLHDGGDGAGVVRRELRVDHAVVPMSARAQAR